MCKCNFFTRIFVLLITITLFSCAPAEEISQPKSSASYDDLVSFFQEWREFVKPEITDGVPDYSAAAMGKQALELKTMQSRLAAYDISSWPISQQVEYHIVRAEMNGLEFDHRVLRPWSRNPCFYSAYYISPSDVPRLEGPWKYGTLCLWKYDFPLSGQDLDQFTIELKAIPGMLAQAKTNLTEDAKDLWFLAMRQKKNESAWLENFASRLSEHHPDLVPDVQSAKAAVDDFHAWLETMYPTKTAPSGIGVENYNWYMKNVHLIPYTWEDQVAILQRELNRSFACLKLEEHRNRDLPKLEPVEDTEEYQRRHNDAVARFMNLLRDEMMTLPEYQNDTLTRTVRVPPPDRLRDFFTQVDLRDPLPLRCHGTHWLDLARMKHEPHPSPIRSTPLLYNIWDSRAEGLATGMEEMAMHAGLMDHNPRVRELVWIMLANRCARGMGDLKMHSHEFDMQAAMKYAVEWTPYRWLHPDGRTVWFDEQLYLEQPGYGTSYVIGKVYFEKVMQDVAHQRGESFTMKQFFDELQSHGMIPLSLIRWEMTGRDDEIKKLLEDD